MPSVRNLWIMMRCMMHIISIQQTINYRSFWCWWNACCHCLSVIRLCEGQKTPYLGLHRGSGVTIISTELSLRDVAFEEYDFVYECDELNFRAIYIKGRQNTKKYGNNRCCPWELPKPAPSSDWTSHLHVLIPHRSSFMCLIWLTDKDTGRLYIGILQNISHLHWQVFE